MYTLNGTEVHAVAYRIGAYDSNSMKSSNPHSGIYQTELSNTLDAINCGYPGCNQGGIMIVQEDAYIYDARGNGDGEISPTITGGHQISISDYTAIVLERTEDGDECV